MASQLAKMPMQPAPTHFIRGGESHVVKEKPRIMTAFIEKARDQPTASCRDGKDGLLSDLSAKT